MDILFLKSSSRECKKKKIRFPLLKEPKLTSQLLTLVYKLFYSKLKLGLYFLSLFMFQLISNKSPISACRRIPHFVFLLFLRVNPFGEGKKATFSTGAIKLICRESTVADHFN